MCGGEILRLKISKRLWMSQGLPMRVRITKCYRLQTYRPHNFAKVHIGAIEFHLLFTHLHCSGSSPKKNISLSSYVCGDLAFKSR